MKSKLLLLLIAAATLCGCERLRDRVTYYTYVNATDKTIVVTLYDQDFYENDEWLYSVNPDAKEVFSFVIAPGEQYTRTLPPYPEMRKYSASPPFEDIEEAVCITVSNGELMLSHRRPNGLFDRYAIIGIKECYEETKSTNKAAYLQCIFDDEFFKHCWPVPVYD